ncbi:MAG: hypothetical protein ACRC53_08940 [Plesiomonas sp.]|uniref:hypothetical protein n=1 Tax=Plesiomonas sp. TaxID=2486279 RepID=UPI003F3C6836
MMPSVSIFGIDADSLKGYAISYQQINIIVTPLLSILLISIVMSFPAFALSLSEFKTRPYFDAGNELTSFDEWHISSGVEVEMNAHWQVFVANQLSLPSVNTGMQHQGVLSGIRYQLTPSLRLESAVSWQNLSTMRTGLNRNTYQAAIGFGSAMQLSPVMDVKAGMNMQKSENVSDIQLGLGVGVDF